MLGSSLSALAEAKREGKGTGSGGRGGRWPRRSGEVDLGDDGGECDEEKKIFFLLSEKLIDDENGEL